MWVMTDLIGLVLAITCFDEKDEYKENIYRAAILLLIHIANRF